MFHGSMVALVTPMKAEGEIDFDSLRALVEMHLEAGTHALVVVGTTGESAALSHKEKSAIIRHTVEQVDNRIPVIAGTYATETKAAIELTHNAMEAGVDGCLIMTPAYVKPTQEGLFQHFSAIAEAVHVPQILYNVPSRTQCDLLPETVARLAAISNIIGIKEATGSTARFKALQTCCAERMDIYSGDDGSACEYMLLGAKGVITVATNVAPALFKDMWESALAKDCDKAIQYDQKLAPLYACLALESNPIPCKWALVEKGLIPSGIRLPLTPLSETHRAHVRTTLEKLS